MAAARAWVQLIVRPLESFLRVEALGGRLLFGATLLALAWANSPYAGTYHAVWHTEVTIGVGRAVLSKPLVLWVNDFLMAVFFLVVGLEVKRELLTGEIDSPRKALLPVAAAIGGMIAPALVFLSVAPAPPESRGWAVPMATDIAFALGTVRLLGGRVPPALVVFLTALAVIDDLGAVLVIALGYSGGIALTPLLVAGGCTALLGAMNVAGVRRPGLYALAGLPLWVAILESGVHATLAGVIVGLCVPARPVHVRADVLEQAQALLRAADAGDPGEGEAALEALEHRLRECRSPLAQLEHALHPVAAFGIVPVFALANAGVPLTLLGSDALTRPACLAVMLGLLVGKPAGVLGATWVAVRLGGGGLPVGMTWRHMAGAGCLAGIGFTMSLFIATLAYGEGSARHADARLGILVASIGSALAGVTVLRGAAPAVPSGAKAPPA